ncbi:MAG: hypothetical protein ACR2MX_10860 [Cyclobacteriaceae bacterium]
MKDIKSLVEICKKKGQRSIQLVNQNFRKKEVSKDNQLYQGIIEERFFSDKDDSTAIFKSDPNSRNYRNAKGKLKQKLLNHLYFLDYEKESYTLADKVGYELEHQLHQSKILIREGAIDIARGQLQHIVKVASQFEFSEMQVAALRLLIRLFAEEGKLNHYRETVSQLERAQALDQSIQKAEQMYYEVIAKSNKSLSSQSKILKDISGIAEQISKLATSPQSTRLDVLSKKLRLLKMKLTSDFGGVLALAEKVEKQYLSIPQNQVRVNFDRKEIAHLKLEATYYLNKISEGTLYAQKAILWFHPGSKHWFDFLELYFLLMMKGEAFKEAADQYRVVRTNKNFAAQSDTTKQRWQIYRAYLLFTYDHKLLRWGFDLHSFINSPSAGSNGTDRFAISTLIIQIMFLLKQGASTKVKEYIKLLEPYNSPHLDKRHNYRNSIFIRLLNIVVKEEFNYQTVKEKGANYLGKLSKMNFTADINGDPEVISYEILWKYIINILETNKVYLHYRFYQS